MNKLHGPADKPVPAQDAIFAAYEAAANLMATPGPPDQDRFFYLTAPVDRPTPKTLFDTALYEITGVQEPKRALASFRKFLIEEQQFFQHEVDLFVESRANRMPPIKRGTPFEPPWWDFGGFLASELPTFRVLFLKWSNEKRIENLPKGKKKSLDGPQLPKRARKRPETRRNTPEVRPKKSKRPSRKMAA